MTNKQTPTSRVLLVMLPMLIFSSPCYTVSSLGEINIKLHGSVVDFTCVVIANGSNRSIELGTWPAKQLQTSGDTTQPVALTPRLEGCPPGSASIAFSSTPVPGTTLLALNDAVMAQKVAIKLHDSDRTRLPFEQVNQTMGIDENGNAALTFSANYITLTNGVQPGLARADVTFMINCN